MCGITDCGFTFWYQLTKVVLNTDSSASKKLLSRHEYVNISSLMYIQSLIRFCPYKLIKRNLVNLNDNIHLTATFQDNLDKPVPKCLCILLDE